MFLKKFDMPSNPYGIFKKNKLREKNGSAGSQMHWLIKKDALLFGRSISVLPENFQI